MGYKIFCLVVFVIQAIITSVDFKIATRYHALCDDESSFVNVLCGVSWGMTACWWLYQAITA